MPFRRSFSCEPQALEKALWTVIIGTRWKRLPVIAEKKRIVEFSNHLNLLLKNEGTLFLREEIIDLFDIDVLSRRKFSGQFVVSCLESLKVKGHDTSTNVCFLGGLKPR